VTDTLMGGIILMTLTGVPVVGGTYALLLSWMERWDRDQSGEHRGIGLLLAHGLSTKLFVIPYRIVAGSILPTAFAAALVVATVYGMSRIAFDFMESGGGICSGGKQADFTEVSVELNTSDQCFATGVKLLANVIYRFEITPSSGWKDGEAAVSPEQSTRAIGWGKWWQLPLRRELFSPWFAVIARVGDKGVQNYVLTGNKPEFTPTQTGPLYLFVNDAVVGFFRSDRFYRDNEGTAKVKIIKVGPPR